MSGRPKKTKKKRRLSRHPCKGPSEFRRASKAKCVFPWFYIAKGHSGVDSTLSFPMPHSARQNSKLIYGYIRSVHPCPSNNSSERCLPRFSLQRLCPTKSDPKGVVGQVQQELVSCPHYCPLPPITPNQPAPKTKLTPGATGALPPSSPLRAACNHILHDKKGHVFPGAKSNTWHMKPI